MKNFFALVSLFAVTVASAQITITQADAMQASDLFVLSNGYSVLPPWTAGSSGPSQTWNFTGAQYDYVDSLQIHAAGWISTNVSALYPQCQLAASSPNDTTSYDLLRIDATGQFVDGHVFYDPQFGLLSSPYSDPFAFIEYPTTYNTVMVDTAYSDVTQPIASGSQDSMRNVLTYITQFTADAWGTATTPLGTFPALRIKRDMSYTGIQFYHDTVTGWSTPQPYSANDRQYEWWVNGIGFPVVRLIVNTNNDSIIAFIVLTAATTGIEEVQRDDFMIYPNPASESFRMNGSVSSKWEIVDVNGRTVKSGVMQSETTEVNVADLSAGMYIVKVTSEGKTPLCSRLIVE